MKIFEGIADGADAARRFFIKNEDDLPEHVQAKLEPLTRTGSSPVDLGAAFTRCVYANQSTMPAAAKDIAAGLADVFDQQGFHQRLDGKAGGIRDALRREAGEAGTFPPADQDPAIDRDYAPPPEPEAPAEAPPAPRPAGAAPVQQPEG